MEAVDRAEFSKAARSQDSAQFGDHGMIEIHQPFHEEHTGGPDGVEGCGRQPSSRSAIFPKRSPCSAVVNIVRQSGIDDIDSVIAEQRVDVAIAFCNSMAVSEGFKPAGITTRHCFEA
jgi:hypothetical protein